ncbi:MAG TPA: hypothetical protein VFZ21_05115 [Gemmatimonadaceae bacterium]|nr:hypothetical protein [Gemmatimonadaceae bacterium]
MAPRDRGEKEVVPSGRLYGHSRACVNLTLPPRSEGHPILASLDHSHIAQLLDGGVSDGQVPYLVIEYVDGQPITACCDRQRLDVPARLRLAEYLEVIAVRQ